MTEGQELGLRNLRYSKSPGEHCTFHTMSQEGWAHREGGTVQWYFGFDKRGVETYQISAKNTAFSFWPPKLSKIF